MPYLTLRRTEAMPERRSMHRRGWIGGLALATLLAASCSPEATVCPNESGRTPIAVEVRDAATGEPAAVGATGSIRDGDVASALVLPHPSERLVLYTSGGVGGRYGTYDVVVQKAGYRDWERKGVYVRGDDDCGGWVKTVTLRANLERIP